MGSVFWLIAFVVLVGIEIATLALTTVWFAGGAIAAFLLSLTEAGVNAQLTVFVAVSFVLLFFTRPWALRHVNRHAIKTNAESLVGKHARVTVQIDNALGTGAAVVNGQEWTARAKEDQEVCPVDAMVEICGINGVKLIVKRMEEEK
ncbi:MAG: NfeD family protein [Hungatella sp.]|nr:NfeD family protein [Hungatella sp.]